MVVVDASGRRQALNCESYEEASDLVDRFDRDLVAGPSVRIGTVLERYLRYLKYKGNRPESITTTTYRLRQFFAGLLLEPIRRVYVEWIAERPDEQQLTLVATVLIDEIRNSSVGPPKISVSKSAVSVSLSATNSYDLHERTFVLELGGPGRYRIGS